MCSGTCLFVNSAFPDTDGIANFMVPVTGWEFTTDDLVVTGERIENMRQAFNLREGIDLTQFKLAGRLLGKPPFKVGPNAGVTVDDKTMIQDYFKEMQWDPETGKPGKKRMAELGLGDVAAELKL